MTEEILTIREVAEYLKVTEKTVYGLAQKHQIPGFKVGGQWRFRREDINAWIATQTAEALTGLREEPATEPEEPRPRRNKKRKSR
jgi:excisionase family DNA binding protein